MKQADSLKKLLVLRNARLQRVEASLARQNDEYDALRAKARSATGRVVAHRDLQHAREQALLNGLVGRVATKHDLERIQLTLAALDEQRLDLERAEREATRARRAALERKKALAVDRDRRRRERDKLTSLTLHAQPALRRRQELLAEVEQEERVQGTAPSDRAWPC
jgi:hypothetical protein